MDRKNKICAIVAKLAQDYADKEIIEELEIPRRTYFYWKKRIGLEGYDVVAQKQKPGPEPKESVDSFVSKHALRWRDRYGWGPGKIAGHLRVHQNIKISHHQIYRLLVETGRNKQIDYIRKIKGKKRYERVHSMCLLHADWKDVLSEPMLTFLDDHSRFVLGSEKFGEATTENVIRLLGQVIKKFGAPEQVLTDHGTQFWNNKTNEPNGFGSFCEENSIKHIKCSKGSPQANGKLESFHGCYDSESWRFKTHFSFIHYWNYKRPHGGVGYLYPAELFFKDMKSASNSG